MEWYQKVLDKFNLDTQRLILVADPDRILKEETILGYLTRQGFEIIEYRDPVAFRYIFEAEFREHKNNKLIVQVLEKNLKTLPYDVLELGISINLSLSDFFPRLSYPVLKELDPGAIGRLYPSYVEYDGGLLGDQGTKEFILQHVYEIVPGLIKNRVQFIKTLISLHCRSTQLSGDLVEFLSGKLGGKEFFDILNGSELISSGEEFWIFLNTQWDVYVRDKIQDTNKCLVPFDHDEIKVYVDNLFVEGKLNPVTIKTGADKLPDWAKVGVKGYEEAFKRKKLGLLLEKMGEIMEQENLSYQHWMNLAPVLAEAKLLVFDDMGSLSSDIVTKFHNAYDKLEALFKEWLFYKYGTLSNLTYTKRPVMVHHIPRFMSYQGRKQEWGKMALVVIDCLAWDQWILIKQQLQNKGNFKVDEGSVFSWIPTMTTISRQAMFAGEPPRFFKDSLFTTSKEEQLWRRFWENEGFKAFSISLIKGLGNEHNAEVEQFITNPKTKVLGLVVDKVDKMVHGQQLGTEGMLQDINLWMQDSYLLDLLNKLVVNGFKVFISSDHGNVAAVGQGKLDQGVLVDSKGERFRTYQNQAFLKDAKEKTKSIEWPNFGLPEGVHVLLAEEQTAYVNEGSHIVSHGGISVEEVIVPFIILGKEE
jgi:hypothetical protein